MIQRIRQRLADRLREREIADLSRAMVEAMNDGLNGYARELDKLRIGLINGRSAECVAKMERAKGLRPRTAIKRASMWAFTRRFIPAWVVIAMFRLLRLRGL